jgi:AraC family transcriptional regulator
MKLAPGRYFGQTLTSASLSGLVLTEKVHQPGDNLPEHFHENAYFCLALEGSWQERTDGKKIHCISRNVVYHPEAEIHQTWFSKEACSKTFNVEITPAWTSKMNAVGLGPITNRIVSMDQTLSFYLGKIYKEFLEHDRYTELAIESILTEVWINLQRNTSKLEKNKTDGWLIDVKKLLEVTYMQPNSLADLSNIHQVHPAYLSKAFRRRFGMTITDYYRQCRVKAACVLLRDSDLSLVSVALECGFYDQSHFCKHFQAIMGMTPLSYRKQYQQKNFIADH